MLDLAESGKQIGEKLFVLLTADQKKELTQFILDNDDPVNSLYPRVFRGKYVISDKDNQFLTEIQEGDLYFCLGQRLVTV